MKKIRHLVIATILLSSGVLYANEAALKAELAAAETDIINLLTGPRTCSPNSQLTTHTDHAVTFSWSAGSKRIVTIRNISYKIVNGTKTEQRDTTYAIEIIQGESSTISATESATAIIIAAPSIKITMTQNGATSQADSAKIVKPCKGGGMGWPNKIKRLSNAAKAYWLWARDRG